MVLGAGHRHVGEAALLLNSPRLRRNGSPGCAGRALLEPATKTAPYRGPSRRERLRGYAVLRGPTYRLRSRGRDFLRRTQRRIVSCVSHSAAAGGVLVSRCGVLGIGRVVSARNRERSESRERRRRSEVSLLFRRRRLAAQGREKQMGATNPRRGGVGRSPPRARDASHPDIARRGMPRDAPRGVAQARCRGEGLYETPSCALERTARRRGGHDPAADKRDSTRDLIRNPAGGEVSSRPARAWMR